jgi:restriction system protein
MKKDLYQALVKQRQLGAYKGYTNISDYHNGVYECNHVSPYTLGADNLDADIMYFLQDWGSSNWMSEPVHEDSAKYGCSLNCTTNRKLKELLKTHLGVEKKETFGTNVFPFIKPGKMSATLKAKDVRKAAADFGLPMIKIIRPKVVIAFGEAAYTGLRTAAGLKKVSGMSEAIETPFKVDDILVCCLAHPGRLGTNNRNRCFKGQVTKDWENLARLVK